MDSEQLKKLLKLELHCHLDGSLSRQFIEERLHRSVSEHELSVSEIAEAL